MLQTITIFTLLVSLSFILIVLINGTVSKSRTAFIFLMSMYVLWAIANYFSLSTSNIDEITFWMRIVMFVTAFLFLGLLEFANCFPQNNQYIKSNSITVIRSYFILLSILTLTDLIIKRANIENGNITPIFGPLVPLYLIGSLMSFTLFVYIMYKKYRNGNRVIRTQIRYVSLGLLLSSLLGFTTNFIFVLVGYTNLVTLGPLFILILLTVLFVLTLKGNFFDIRIFIGRFTYYIIVSFFVLAGYYLSVNLGRFVLGNESGVRSLILGLPLAIAFIILYDIFKKFVQERIDSTLINPDFDPKDVISGFNNEISGLLSYDDIVDHAITIIGKTIRPRYKGIMVKVDNELELTDDSEETNNINLNFDKLVQIWKETGNYPIISDEIEIELPRVFRAYRSDIFEFVKMMKNSHIKVILPIASPDSIVGILLIGQREADAPYNSIQIDYLESIANLVGLALTRAFLYQEVREFNETLQRKVEIATQELAKQNDKLKETLANERDMLDVLGHELRTPLGIIRNALGLFELTHKSGKVKKEDIDKFVDIANNNIRREIQLLETILASAKIDNAKLDLNFEKINSADIVKESFEAYKYEAEKKNLKLTTDIPSEPLPSYVDKLRIQQVLDNLVSNAIKYTETGEVVIGIKDEGKFIRYYVKDTGYGIPKEDIPKLGQKFFRVNTYLNSNGKIGDRKIVRPGGNGIGLYVVFQLVKYMGGEVHVESVVGKGSTFSFTVLKYTPEVESQHEILTQAKSQNGKK